MKYLDLAVKIAMADIGVKDRHFLFGCVAMRKDGAVIVSTNIRTQKPTIAAHAESRALKKCGHGAILWLARINRHGQWAMAKPCNRCQSLIRNRLVERVYFTIAPNMVGRWNVNMGGMISTHSMV